MNIDDNETFFQLRFISAIFVVGLCMQKVGYYVNQYNYSYPEITIWGKILIFICSIICLLYMGKHTIYMGSKGFILGQHTNKIRNRIFMLPYLIYSIICFPIPLVKEGFSNKQWYVLLIVFTLTYVSHLILEYTQTKKLTKH